MSGDYTRQTFRKYKHYSGVRLQQGRVQLDADWNEQVDITHHTERVTTTDVVGPTGFPENDPGFAVTGRDGDLLLGTGRGYVDGILVENDDKKPTSLKPALIFDINPVWEVTSGPPLQENQWVNHKSAGLCQVTNIQVNGGGDGKQRVKFSKNLGAHPTEVTGLVSVAFQPHLRNVTVPTNTGQYLLYLDVWEREITFLEDEEIKERALGGADTALRTQVIWQAKLLNLSKLIASKAISNPPVCADFRPGWSPRGDESPAQMAAHAKPSDKEPKPCVLPSAGGYRSLENHLYRVEIHVGGRIDKDKVYVKWSSDNAVHRTRYSEIKSGSLVVESQGKDAVVAFKSDDWVEVLDEARILAEEPGFFVHLGERNEDQLEIKKILDPVKLHLLVDSNLPDTKVLPSKGFLRRWEGGTPVEVKKEKWIPLERGVEVMFDKGRVFTGDHWLVPARTLEGKIEWPTDATSDDPLFEPPVGVHHHYSALAMASLDNSGVWTTTDCRNIFPPLTRQLSLFYVSGDGQEATPDPLNPNSFIAVGQPLQVGVSRGSTSVENTTVEFAVTQGKGRLNGGASPVYIKTSPAGIASVNWEVDGNMLDQQVTAKLLDSAKQVVHIPIVFTARLSRAGEVSFDPSNCAPLAGSKTVQKALEGLCKLGSGGCATYIVTPQSDWVGLLEGIKSGEDAHICFERGHYQARRMVKIRNLGHISISGMGDGTRIEIWQAESALHFKKCTSVSVSRLSLSAPDRSEKLKHIRHLNGTLTVENCPRVDIHDLSVKCGAGAKTERTCITVKGTSKNPIQSIRIVDNQLAVGHNQIGALFINAVISRVENNEIFVTKRSPKFSFNVQLKNPKFRAKLANMLVSQAVLEDKVPTKDKAKSLSAGKYVARMRSSIPESEWRALMKQNPPEEADKKSKKAFKKYVNNLVEMAVDEPQHLPSYKDEIDRIGGADLEHKVKKSLAIRGSVEIINFTELSEEKRNTAMVVDNHRIAYDSPVPGAEWQRILKANNGDVVQSNFELLANVRKSAKRLIVDEKFRNRFTAVKSWIGLLKLYNPAVGSQGLVCGGQRLIDVRVRGNRIRGFFEGIHLGVSEKAYKGKAPLQAGSIDISDNRVELRIPVEEKAGLCGIFIGNARRITVIGNDLNNVSQSNPKKMFTHGIRIWGHLGNFVVLRQNSTRDCTYGVFVKPLKIPKGRLWRAVDNLAANGSFSVPGFKERDNVKI